jgi:hypothetical protein
MSWFIYLATVTLDVLLPKKANSAVILGLPYLCFFVKINGSYFALTSSALCFLSETDWLFH